MMDLLKYNKEIDKRVMNVMKSDNIQEARKNIFYGKDDKNTTSLQMSARQLIQ